MNISVVTPTNGKRLGGMRHVCEALNSILSPRDEHIIVWDGAPQLSSIPKHSQLNLRKVSKESVYGNVQRDFGILHASKDCIVFLDDDDLPCRDAFDILHAVEPEGVCHMFAMREQERLFKAGGISVGSVGGPQLVVPNRDDLPKWSEFNAREADYKFMLSCDSNYGSKCWAETICFVRPTEEEYEIHGKNDFRYRGGEC